MKKGISMKKTALRLKRIALSLPLRRTTGGLVLAALVATAYFSSTLSLQPILNKEAQFTMLVSLLLFILSYCLFMNRLQGRIERNTGSEAEKKKPFWKRQLFLLTVAASVLFLSLLLCLARIWIALLKSSLNSCLPHLDGSVIFTFCVAIGVSIAIFIDAYWLEPKREKKCEKWTLYFACSPSKEGTRIARKITSGDI